LTLDQPVAVADEYETPMDYDDDLQEEIPEPEPEIVIPKTMAPVIAKVAEKDIKVAIPVAIAEGLVTTRAKKTCKKFVGKWITLRQGKTITDAKEVIEHLRMHDLVE
jgi:hypothetical protein